MSLCVPQAYVLTSETLRHTDGIDAEHLATRLSLSKLPFEPPVKRNEASLVLQVDTRLWSYGIRRCVPAFVDGCYLRHTLEFGCFGHLHTRL